MRGSPSVWALVAASTCALGSMVQKPYAMNSTAPALIPPPYASGTGLLIPPLSSSEPCDTLTSSSSSWPAASAVPYPTVSLPTSSFVIPTASLVYASLSQPLKTHSLVIVSTLSSSAAPTSAVQPASSPHITNKAAIVAGFQASSSIDLELLSSILLSGLPPIYTETRTAIASSTQPNLHSTRSSDSDSSLSAAPTTLVAVTSVTATPPPSSNTPATEFPTSPPFSYNPSASQGSATPISRPTPEPSSANAAGSTLSTSATSSTTGEMDIPPAPSAAGAPGGSSGRGKERVWWVAFLVPCLLAA